MTTDVVLLSGGGGLITSKHGDGAKINDIVLGRAWAFSRIPHTRDKSNAAFSLLLVHYEPQIRPRFCK